MYASFLALVFSKASLNNLFRGDSITIVYISLPLPFGVYFGQVMPLTVTYP